MASFHPEHSNGGLQQIDVSVETHLVQESPLLIPINKILHMAKLGQVLEVHDELHEVEFFMVA